jgi:hypothetical protein
MIHLEQRQVLAQAVFALTWCGAAPSHRRYPLTQAQIEALQKAVLICQPQAAST